MERIRLVSIEQLLEMKENKDNFKLVEVLGEESYKQEYSRFCFDL